MSQSFDSEDARLFLQVRVVRGLCLWFQLNLSDFQTPEMKIKLNNFSTYSLVDRFERGLLNVRFKFLIW